MLEGILVDNMPANKYLSAKLTAISCSNFKTASLVEGSRLTCFCLSFKINGEMKLLIFHPTCPTLFKLFKLIDPLLVDLASEKHIASKYFIMGKIMWYLGQATPLLAGSKSTSDIFMYTLHELCKMELQPFKKGELMWDILAMLTPDINEYAKNFINLFNFIDRKKLLSESPTSTESANATSSSSSRSFQLFQPQPPPPASSAHKTVIYRQQIIDNYLIKLREIDNDKKKLISLKQQIANNEFENMMKKISLIQESAENFKFKLKSMSISSEMTDYIRQKIDAMFKSPGLSKNPT